MADAATLIGHLVPNISHKAMGIIYDPTVSGLTATNVQAAIDEVAASVSSLGWPAVLAIDATTGGNNPTILDADKLLVGTSGDIEIYLNSPAMSEFRIEPIDTPVGYIFDGIHTIIRGQSVGATASGGIAGNFEGFGGAIKNGGAADAGAALVGGGYSNGTGKAGDGKVYGGDSTSFNPISAGGDAYIKGGNAILGHGGNVYIQRGTGSAGNGETYCQSDFTIWTNFDLKLKDVASTNIIFYDGSNKQTIYCASLPASYSLGIPAVAGYFATTSHTNGSSDLTLQGCTDNGAITNNSITISSDVKPVVLSLNGTGGTAKLDISRGAAVSPTSLTSISSGAGANTLTLPSSTGYLAIVGASTGVINHLSDVSNVGTNTHAQIDTHISSTSNPHSTTLAQALTEGQTTSGKDIQFTTTDKAQFRDSAIYIQSTADGYLDLVADDFITATTETVIQKDTRARTKNNIIHQWNDSTGTMLCNLAYADTTNKDIEIRFGDSEDTKIGFPENGYMAFLGNSTEFWMGNAADGTLYFNFYNGYSEWHGTESNLQTDITYWATNFAIQRTSLLGFTIAPPSAASNPVTLTCGTNTTGLRIGPLTKRLEFRDANTYINSDAANYLNYEAATGHNMAIGGADILSIISTKVDINKPVYINIDSGTAPSISANTGLIVKNCSATTDEANISIIAGATGKSTINLGSTVNENQGGITYFHNLSILGFGASGDNTDLFLDGEQFSPGTANAKMLGSESNEWDDLYFTPPATATCNPVLMLNASTNRVEQLNVPGITGTFLDLSSNELDFRCGILYNFTPP